MQLPLMIVMRTCNTVNHVESTLRAGNLSTMLTDSGSADAPTIYDGVSTEGATTSTNTPTTYSTFLSEGDISKVHAVPTAVGVLCFLLVLIGVLVGLFVVVLYLHSKRKNDRRYKVFHNYV